jgi:hypothetical protein
LRHGSPPSRWGPIRASWVRAAPVRVADTQRRPDVRATRHGTGGTRGVTSRPGHPGLAIS